MKKRVFRTHILLVTEGRLLSLLFIAAIGWMLYASVKFCILDFEPVFLLFLLFTVGMGLLGYFLAKYFWQLCWGKLMVTHTCLKWKCIGYKTQTIRFEEIKRIYVRAFNRNQGNVVRDAYQTGFRYVVILSKNGSPQSYGGRIKNGNGVISFPYNEKLRKALLEVLPEKKSFLPK
jgi:hypothetical protein